MKNPWKTNRRRVVYDNPWIKVSHNDVINPSGNPGIYGVVHFKNEAIGVIPLDDEYNTWLVGQYRYPLNRYSWEIPEGGGPKGTKPLDSAKRELLEETGLTAQHWQVLINIDLSNSICDEQGTIFLARDLKEGPPQPEETEDLQIRKLPVQEAIAMVFRGEITDAMSVIGLLYLDHMLRVGEI